MHSDNFEIYVMNSDGSNQKRLTYNDYNDDAPQFSPKGIKIIFYSSAPEKGWYGIDINSWEKRRYDVLGLISPDEKK
jgi:TolB protein